MGNSRTIQIIIETAKGSRNKYKLDAKLGIFMLSKVLPEGMSFPLDFGFVPKTKGEDGDPLDVLVLMDEPAFPGCLVEVRLIGAFEGEQTERGATYRNDRLVAVSVESHHFAEVNEIDQLPRGFLQQMEGFLENYHLGRPEQFKMLRRGGSKRAWALLKKAQTGAKAA